MLLFVVTVWGSNFVVIKLVLEVMHPHVANLFRLIAAGVVLGFLHYRRQKKLNETFFAPLRAFPRELALIGLVGWSMYQVAFITGLDRTTAGTAGLIMASLPLWTALLAVVMRLERLNRAGWMGILISIAGTFIVILSSDKDVGLGKSYLIGNLIMLGAALLWAMNTVLTRKLVDRVTPLSITLMGLLLALPVLALLAIPFWSAVEWDRVNWLVWVAIFFSGSLSTGIVIVMWNQAVKTVGAAHTAAFQNLVPVVTLVVALIVLKEPILGAQLLGGSATIAGLITMRRGREPAAPPN